MKKSIVIIIAVAVLLCAGMAGAAVWWVQQQGGGEKAQPPAPKIEPSQYSYVTLDKIVVMLRLEEGRTQNSYLSLDLVFRTDKAHEKAVKGELPMLKGVAVRAASQIGVTEAKAMTIDAWTDLLRRELMGVYESRLASRNFDEVMVARLIIE